MRGNVLRWGMWLWCAMGCTEVGLERGAGEPPGDCEEYTGLFEEDGMVPQFLSGGGDAEAMEAMETAGADGSIGSGECWGHQECETGWCLLGSAGGHCALACGEEGCGEGARCDRVALASEDPLWVCVPDRTPYCRPCDDASQCDVEGRCLSGGGALGSYCTRACDARSPCPPAFSCYEGVCRAAENRCDCLRAPGSVGLTTKCAQGNAWGVCEGVRMCTEEGLGPCSAVLPGQEECDGVDNDCDGQVDESIAEESCIRGNPLGYCTGRLKCLERQLHCDAAEPSAEVCDGVDNDCDGVVDEEWAVGCLMVYPDADGDGFGAGEEACVCKADSGWAWLQGDCDDTAAALHPGAEELCDGKDNNCVDGVDEACDGDKDGYCTGAKQVVSPNCPKGALDCDDWNSSVHPNGNEACDGVDNDCDGQVDEECDVDQDGYCGKVALAFGPGMACHYSGWDCDDDDASVNPGAEELYDGVDNDCNGQTDDVVGGGEGE